MRAQKSFFGRRSLLMLAVFALIAAACVNAGGTDDDEPTPNEVEPIVAKEPSEPTTIRFSVFSSVAEAPQMKQFKEDFEAEYPNITVDYEPVGSGRAREKLLTEIAGGNAPDAAFVDAGFVQDLASRGGAMNLDGYIAGSEVVSEEDYVEGFRNTALLEGSMYGLPWDGETTGLFYRTDLFQEAGIESPPETWEEFEQTAAALTDPSKNQYGVAMFASEAAYYWYPWLWQAGGDLLSADGQDIAFDTPEGIEAAEFYVDVAKKYAPPDYLASDSWNGRVTFASGKAAMYIAGSWFAGNTISEFPDITGKWATAPLPQGDAGCATTLAGDSLIVLDDTENADAAWLWIEFLSRPENMTTWTIGSETSTLLPPRRSILESPDLAEGKPYMEGFANDMGCAVVSNIEQPKFPEVETVLNEKLGEAMFGEITAEEAITQAAEEGEEIIDG
ncbi:MAG TPA: extracellular solute-binding protein [Actinomycetota bacterium]|nr:extracellular solute-binding protein [Actinomycetota bacterium]